jgi:chemotaxis protein CheC
MTDFGGQIQEADVDRMREFASIGAGHAANALAGLIGRPCWMRVPTVRLLTADRVSEPYVADVTDAARKGMVGVFFEVEGGLGGVIALLFPAQSCKRLVDELLGGRADRSRGVAESAMREVGNILASHVANSLGDLMGLAVLPSTPELVMQDATGALARLLAERASDGPALRIETEIADGPGDIRGVLVFVPDRVEEIAPVPGF